MRQAGRYLPEYRASRKTAGSFLELCKNKNFATEVALQPLDRYPYLDAAMLFSDILTVPDAMGLGLHFVEGEGPKFKYPLHDEEAIFKLDIPDVEESLKYVFDAVKSINSSASVNVVAELVIVHWFKPLFAQSASKRLRDRLAVTPS